MTQEEKQLLLKDLCARLPYGIKVHLLLPETMENGYTLKEINTNGNTIGVFLDKGKDSLAFAAVRIENEYGEPSVKPYLRPMSSMTEEEIKTYRTLQDTACSYHYEFGDIVDDFLYFDNDVSLDYLNSIHIDYRGLIEKGLALEAPEGMYN